jgi:hypothetical protein
MSTTWDAALIRMTGRDPEAPADPADMVRCLAERYLDSSESHAALLGALRGHPGFFSLFSGSFVPMNVALARQGMLARSPRPRRVATLLDALSASPGFMEFMNLAQLATSVARYPVAALDAAHARRRDPSPEPFDASGQEDAAAHWSAPARQGMLPHIDSLTGLVANLQFVAMSIRCYDWNPRSLHVFAAGERILHLPAGMRFEVALHPNLECDFIWSAGSRDVVAPEIVEDLVHEIARAEVTLFDKDGETLHPGQAGTEVAQIRVHSSMAHGLMAAVGSPTASSRPLSWTEPAAIAERP